MKDQGKLITGVVVGAGAMYLLDPDRGARRRSLLRDRGVHAGHKLGDGLAATARDARNRTRGTAAALRARFRTDAAGEEVLHERVRSAIGRVVSHPGAITVVVTGDRITLTGQVLADEVDELIHTVGQVRGVSEVRNELEIHDSPAGVPSLQGPGRPRSRRPDVLQDNWAPATRLLVGVAGGLLLAQGMRSRGIVRKSLSAVGVGLLTRAISNTPPKELVNLGSGARGIEVEKTIRVGAPVQQVWELWSNFENFPRFMTHLREVRKVDEGRSHWVAAGPAGIPVEWDAIVTDWVPQQFIGWSSVEGSTIETTGQVRFRPTSTDSTEIDIRMEYSPPAGAAGHAIASLLGTDPKRAMDDDLVRLKSLLEDGKTRAAGQEVHLEEVTAPEEKKSTTSRRRKS
ncbi:MAG TPA: SRPBCC family protein [Gemmatimonadales bacterium]|nr:SRPBCC family protein [Gemmatimonadales bacterium]